MFAIDLSPAFTMINEGLKILLSGGVICIMGYVTWLLHTKAPKFIDAQTQAKIAAVINDGLNRAVQYALNMAATEETKAKPTTDSLIVKIGAQYAVNHLGDTLAKAGKTPDDIAEMIVARLPVAPAVPDGPVVVVPKATAVVMEPLPQIQTPSQG